MTTNLRGRFFDDQSAQLDRFGPLFGLTVLTVVVLSLVRLDRQEDSLATHAASAGVSIVIGVTLLLALRASGVAQRWRRAADIFVAVAVALSLGIFTVDLLSDADLSAYGLDRPSPIWVAVALVTPVAVVRRLLTHRRVSVGTLQGAIAAYLLIAVAFSYLFTFIDDLGSAGPFFEQTDDPASTSFTYFSLVTITTLGYGDLSPSGDLGRFLATTEAVVGQVYLVTFVAMIVGLLSQQRGQP